VVLNNETSPILTTYHAIRNLSVELVPDFHLHDGSMSLPLPYTPAHPRHPTTTPPQPTTSPPPARAINVRVATTHSASPESPRLNFGATPPLLAIACEMPETSSDLSTSSPTISTFDELLNSEPFTFEKAAKVAKAAREHGFQQETDFFGYPLPTSISMPAKRAHTPPPIPMVDSPAPSPTFRPRGESDPSLVPPDPDFDLAAEEEPNHSFSTPSSPIQPEILSFSTSDLVSSSPPECGRARALSASDVSTWPHEFSVQEEIHEKDPWTFFNTLEDENGILKLSIISPLLSFPLPLFPY
jgi:hypothetical protein